MALDFKLSDEFVNSYKDKEVPWGYKDGAGNSLGEITTLRTYSRVKEDGTKEKWHEICRRVIEGMFTLQKRHARQNRIEWKNDKAQRTAKDAYDRMFNMKWLPPGRGIWSMGSPLVMDDNNSASLQNCAACSSEESVVEAAIFLFDASMLGVGVGFDSLGADKFPVLEPEGSYAYVIPDSREGWVESLRLLLAAYIDEGKKRNPLPVMDYSEVRPAGAPIKRFGGIASGPGPLKDLHEKVKNLLDSRIGSKITMRDINDIMNMIGVAVIAGNVRRSAELSLVDSDSPDVQEFTDLKDYDKNPDRVGHGFMANNSIRVKVGDDYTPFLEGIKLNGEPGFVWKDISTSYSRLKDAPDFKDVRATLVNPCSFSGDTLVHTTEGAKTIESLKDRPFWALVDGEAFFSPVGSYVTGQKDLFRLETEEGYEVTLTDNHEVLTESGEWVEAGKLNAGDKIVLHNHRDAPFFPGEGSWDEGYLIGNLVGDGNLVQSGHGRLSVWDNGDPESAQAMMTQMEESIDRVYNGLSNIRSDAKTKFTPRGEPFNMYYMSLSGKLLSKFDVVYGNKTTTPKIEASSSDFHRGYLRGLFDADGHLEGVSNDKGLSVRLGQSDLKSLKAVQRMLLRFGIKSSIRKAKDSGEALLPDGRGGHKLYPTKESWRLIVSADSVFLFQEYIGFTHTAKKTNLRRGVESKTRGFYRTKYTATFKSLTYERFDDVWDLSVSTKKAFDANGLYVHNSEQNLESGETCTLCEVFIGNCTNQDDFIKTLKVAFMYGKTVTLLPTKWEKTNAILLRNRRIGLSVSGVADYVDAHGLPALRKSLDDGYNYVTKLDKKYSEWLCVRESVKRTTVKPAGSISLVAGSSPGVHWTPGGEYFIRRITFAKTDPLFEALKDAGYEHSDLEWDPKSAVILFPIHSKSKRSAADVPAWEKINLAAEMQHWWSDNAVSCTVDFKPAEAGDIPKLLNMYEGRLKGISFLPAIEKGAYKNMPYEQISKDTYEEMKSTIHRADFTHVYSQGIEAVGEAFCTSDKCETEIETNAMTLEVPTINLDEV